MNITVAENAGFCFGVKKAVDKVFELMNNGEKICVLGELIHNRSVIDKIESGGVVTIGDVDECEAGATLVIRTHGVSREVLLKAQKKAKEVIDLTCPYVKKIHNIVNEHSKEGFDIVIIGDKTHPEVLGIKGWCAGNVYIVYNEQEAENIDSDKFCVVAQTTINRQIYENLIKILKKDCKEVLIFDTICKSTKTRQTEADEISRKSDVMFVIGGKGSSNTRRLYDICKTNCPQTYFIENFEDIPQNINYKNKKIGITAGASTPQSSIEEVVKTMEENKINGELSFAEAFEQSLKTLNTGDVVTGTVVDVNPTEVIVDLGFKSDGVIPADQLTDDPDVRPQDIVKPGDEITVFVVRVNDAEGKTLLSKKKIDEIEGKKELEEAVESKKILSGKVIQITNGGVIVLVNGSRVFVPARQAADRYIEDLSVLLNQSVELRITEINTRRRNGGLKGSIRSVLEEQKKALTEKFWAEAEAGKVYNGVVKSIMPFGVFVDIGGVDGLVHISELSWNRIKDPSEVVKVGDSIEVYIKEINAETKKISLGFKKAEDNPWVIAQNKFNLDDVVSVKVVRFMPFGAFVELIPGVDGLVHISQIANKHIAKPADELTIGQTVEAKITELNWETKRISLSIRALLAKDEPVEEVAEEAVEEVAEEVIAEEAAVEEAPVVEEVAEEAAETTEE